MIQVTPVACTAINWQVYLRIAKDILGEPISETFDQAGMQPGLPAFIISLGDLADDDRVAHDLIKDAGKRLRHVSVSFLAVVPSQTLLAFVEEVDLVITSGDSRISGFKIILMTGNLEQWRNAIVDCSVERVNSDVRYLFNKCHSYFEKEGLAGIWSKYSKTQCHDNTYKLLPK